MNTVQTAFARIEQERPGYTPWVGFVAQGGTAVYTLEPSDRPDLPGTHKLTGNHGSTYGYWTETSGRPVPVRRSGWYATRGVLGTFDTKDAPTPGSDAPTMRVRGWAVTGVH